MNCMHLPTSVRCTSDVQHVHILLFSDLHKEKHVAFEFSLFLHFPLDRIILVWDSTQHSGHEPEVTTEHLERGW